MLNVLCSMGIQTHQLSSYLLAANRYFVAIIVLMVSQKLVTSVRLMFNVTHTEQLGVCEKLWQIMQGETMQIKAMQIREL